MKYINENQKEVWVLQKDLSWAFSVESEIELPEITLSSTPELVVTEIEDIRETAPIKSMFLTGLPSACHIKLNFIALEGNYVVVSFGLLVFSPIAPILTPIHLKDLVLQRIEMVRQDPSWLILQRSKEDIQNECDKEFFKELKG